MESVILNDQEQRIYADLFCRCDAGNSGKVTGIKATELFMCSGLPPETLHQVNQRLFSSDDTDSRICQIGDIEIPIAETGITRLTRRALPGLLLLQLQLLPNLIWMLFNLCTLHPTVAS